MIVLADAVAGQVVRKLITSAIELAVADLSIAAHDGQAPGHRVGSMLEKVSDVQRHGMKLERVIVRGNQPVIKLSAAPTCPHAAQRMLERVFSGQAAERRLAR